MKVPVSWLREYVAFDLPVEELARRLVFTSCEVDRIVRRGVADEDGNLGRFRVGRVAECAATELVTRAHRLATEGAQRGDIIIARAIDGPRRAYLDAANVAFGSVITGASFGNSMNTV